VGNAEKLSLQGEKGDGLAHKGRWDDGGKVILSKERERDTELCVRRFKR